METAIWDERRCLKCNKELRLGEDEYYDDFIKTIKQDTNCTVDDEVKK